jgi:hypothetical protein
MKINLERLWNQSLDIPNYENAKWKWTTHISSSFFAQLPYYICCTMLFFPINPYGCKHNKMNHSKCNWWLVYVLKWYKKVCVENVWFVLKTMFEI